MKYLFVFCLIIFSFHVEAQRIGQSWWWGTDFFEWIPLKQKYFEGINVGITQDSLIKKYKVKKLVEVKTLESPKIKTKWMYSFDESGNLLKAKNELHNIQLRYDSLNRVVFVRNEIKSLNVQEASFVYDSIGRVKTCSSKLTEISGTRTGLHVIQYDSNHLADIRNGVFFGVLEVKNDYRNDTLISQVQYIYDSRKEIKYNYDSTGLTVLYKEYDKNKLVIQTVSRYDKVGKLISMSEINSYVYKKEEIKYCKYLYNENDLLIKADFDLFNTKENIHNETQLTYSYREGMILSVKDNTGKTNYIYENNLLTKKERHSNSDQVIFTTKYSYTFY